MIVAEEDTSATIFLIFFHNHPVKSIDFLSLCVQIPAHLTTHSAKS